MSALGQKQTYAVQKAMSALPPKADMCSAQGHVRLVPKADIRTSRRLEFHIPNPAKTPDLLQPGLTHSIEEFD